jgi:hypothetical protein
MFEKGHSFRISVTAGSHAVVSFASAAIVAGSSVSVGRGPVAGIRCAAFCGARSLSRSCDSSAACTSHASARPSAGPSAALSVSRRWVILLSSRKDSHQSAFAQSVGPVNDYPVPLREAAQDIGGSIGSDSYLNRFQVDSRTVVHRVHERTLLPSLNRYVGNHQLIGQCIDQEPHVHELLGEEREIVIVENRL